MASCYSLVFVAFFLYWYHIKSFTHDVTLYKEHVKGDSTASEDYILHFGSEANECFVGILGGIRVWKLRRSLPASLCSPDRLWQRELQANRLDNNCLRQPYKLRMTYDEVLWSERQDRKYQDLICVRLAMMVMNSCGWLGLSAKVLKFMQWGFCMYIIIHSAVIYCWTTF